MLTLIVPRPPQRPLRESYQTLGDETRFGDGYTDAGAQVNPIRRSVDVEWRLPQADAAALLAFLAARRGVVAFGYALPGEAEAAWVAPAWTAVWASHDLRIVSATLISRVAFG